MFCIQCIGFIFILNPPPQKKSLRSRSLISHIHRDRDVTSGLPTSNYEPDDNVSRFRFPTIYSDPRSRSISNDDELETQTQSRVSKHDKLALKLKKRSSKCLRKCTDGGPCPRPCRTPTPLFAAIQALVLSIWLEEFYVYTNI